VDSIWSGFYNRTGFVSQLAFLRKPVDYFQVRCYARQNKLRRDSMRAKSFAVTMSALVGLSVLGGCSFEKKGAIPSQIQQPPAMQPALPPPSAPTPPEVPAPQSPMTQPTTQPTTQPMTQPMMQPMTQPSASGGIQPMMGTIPQ
jgi:hypothetical protein